jgi:hypothetical protein
VSFSDNLKLTKPLKITEKASTQKHQNSILTTSKTSKTHKI